MSDSATVDESHVLKQVIDSLRNLSDDSRNRVLKTVLTYFDFGGPCTAANASERVLTSKADREPSFGNRPSLSVKDFMHQKDPKTDVERVTCLAYYLANYRDVPYFRTEDISALNTEAAQIKLSNASLTVTNAVRAGLLTLAGAGKKQISMHGEKVVLALPDREKVRDILKTIRRRMSRKRLTGDRKNHQTGEPE